MWFLKNILWTFSNTKGKIINSYIFFIQYKKPLTSAILIYTLFHFSSYSILEQTWIILCLKTVWFVSLTDVYYNNTFYPYPIKWLTLIPIVSSLCSDITSCLKNVCLLKVGLFKSGSKQGLYIVFGWYNP